MNQDELKEIIPNPENIGAVVLFRLSENTSFICVATFVAASDARIFVENVIPRNGIGQYRVVEIGHEKDIPMKIDHDAKGGR